MTNQPLTIPPIQERFPKSGEEIFRDQILDLVLLHLRRELRRSTRRLKIHRVIPFETGIKRSIERVEQLRS